jgi:hypothetical protein
MDDVTAEVMKIKSTIDAHWRHMPNIRGASEAMLHAVILLIPEHEDNLLEAYDGNPTWTGASIAVARRALELGAPVATVNFLVAVHFGA